MDDDLDSLIDAMRDVSSSKAQSQEAQEADELTAVHLAACRCMQLHAAACACSCMQPHARMYMHLHAACTHMQLPAFGFWCLQRMMEAEARGNLKDRKADKAVSTQQNGGDLGYGELQQQLS